MEINVNNFWDIYQESGIAPALEYVESLGSNLKELEGEVPALVGEAKARDIDLIKFLTELDEALLEKENASGITDDGSELPSDSSGEVGESQDEDEPAEARDADAEGGATD